MAKKKKFIRFTITREQAHYLGIDALMDMLRYDNCRILSNAPTGTYLLENTHGPTHDRWQSFGIIVQLIS